MTDRGRRFGKGIAIALAVHIIAAALLGILGYRFTQRPPQILEVTWGGGGGGGGKGSAAAEKGTAETAAATVQQQKQQSAPVRTDDIVDRKQKPQTQQQEQPRQPQSSSTSSEAAQSNVKSGETGGTGTGGGEGTGAGTGQGSGEGSGSGTGSGSGSGGGVPVTPPYLVSSTDPRYPPAARNREIEGTVYVKMLVSSGGSVENAFVARSSGNEALDGAAVEAVYNWNFSPAKDTYGSPVRCYITMPVNFVLH